jgi:hypothetical protein
MSIRFCYFSNINLLLSIKCTDKLFFIFLFIIHGAYNEIIEPLSTMNRQRIIVV